MKSVAEMAHEDPAALVRDCAREAAGLPGATIVLEAARDLHEGDF